MKSNFINRVVLEGVVYQHTLEKRVSGPNSANPGSTYITGNLDIATDDAKTNIVTVHFTYVTPSLKSGKENETYTVLHKIISGEAPNYMESGASAACVRVDTSIGLNEYYTDRNGKEELVSAKRNEGGFVRLVRAINENEALRNTFEADMIITNAHRVEGDPDKNTQDKVVIKGAIFDYRKNLLPVAFDIYNEDGMAYFEDAEPSNTNPFFTKISGTQISTVVERKIIEESAFGGDSVRSVKNSHKAWVVVRSAKEPYIWDDESTITAKELQEAMAQREISLATVKKRQDEYKANKNAAPAFATPSGATFNF